MNKVQQQLMTSSYLHQIASTDVPTEVFNDLADQSLAEFVQLAPDAKLEYLRHYDNYVYGGGLTHALLG